MLITVYVYHKSLLNYLAGNQSCMAAGLKKDDTYNTKIQINTKEWDIKVYTTHDDILISKKVEPTP